MIPRDVQLAIGFLLVVGFVIVLSACFRAVGTLTEIKTLLEAIRGELQKRNHADPKNERATPEPSVHVLSGLSDDEKRKLYRRK